MSALLGAFSKDPRAALKGGFADAETAIMNLNHVAELPKPAGFFDPENVSGLPPIVKRDKAGDDEQSLENTEWGTRSPLLSFSNTDMAFSGDVMVAGSYHGFNVYKLGADGVPDLHSCLLYTSPSPRDATLSRMPSSA